MELAIVDGKRTEPFPGGRGTCEMCGDPAVAKCGSIKLHHWAHHGRYNCDPWWENETEWHRQWKSHYPVGCREVVHQASSGEVHRSDIRTPSGLYIEVQHSHLPEPERVSRENFYGNLIWIVDGRSFRQRFEIYHPLPSPRSELSQDLVWSRAKRGQEGANRGLFFRVSEARQYEPMATRATLRGGQIHSIREIQAAIESSYEGHHQYDWIRPHQGWLVAGCPVYLDFGDAYLVRLQVFDHETRLPCVRLVAKSDFIKSTLLANKAIEVLPD